MMDEARYREPERTLWAWAGVEPTERFLQLERNGVRARVQEVGDGPPVLFVHGANNSGVSWAKLAAGMPGFRCILLDRPGCGLSEPLATTLNADTFVTHFETVLIDVLDALGLESAHLAATSYGGHMALRTAAAHPGRVDRMVQFSWPVGAPISRLPMFMRMTSVPLMGRLMLSMPVNERTVKMLFRRLGHADAVNDGRIGPEIIGCWMALLRHTDTMRNDTAPGRALMSPIKGFNEPLRLTEDLLARIQTPTLYIWGEKDPFGGVESARNLVELMPNAELDVMPGAGHAPWLDDVDHVAKETVRFLSA